MTCSSFLCRCSLALTSNYSCPRVSQNSHLVTEEQCRLRKTSQPDSYRMVRPLKLFSCIFAFADWWHPGTSILLKTTGNVCLGGTQATKCVHTKPGRLDHAKAGGWIKFFQPTLLTLWYSVLSSIKHGNGGNNCLYHLTLEGWQPLRHGRT